MNAEQTVKDAQIARGDRVMINDETWAMISNDSRRVGHPPETST